MTNISYTAPPNYRAGSDPSQAGKNKNPNDPNMVTTGAYGSAFELALDTVRNGDGSTSDALTYRSYDGKTNGSFSTLSETGTGGDLPSAYQSLLASLQANGEMNESVASQVRDAFNQLQTKSSEGGTGAVVSGGGLLVQAGGPIPFAGISAYQNGFVDSLITELTSELQHNSLA